MAVNRPAAPVRDPLVDTAGMVTGNPWLTWLREIRADIDAAPVGFSPVVVEAHTATIPTTAIPTDAALSAGVYRVSWAAKVVTVAGVASSFQITISWTWKTVTQQCVGTLKNGNLTTTYELSSVPLMYVDAATPITYALAYVSNPAAAMAFDLFLTLERLAAL